MKTETHTAKSPHGLSADHQDVWRGAYRCFPFKIVRLNRGKGYTPGGEGSWAFYLYLHESKVADFASLWLEDKLEKYTPTSAEHVSRDYMSGRLLDIELHGGITYYEKHGYSEGHRAVEVGCDYSHLWDHERAGGFTCEEILYDVKRAIDSLFDHGFVKTGGAS